MDNDGLRKHPFDVWLRKHPVLVGVVAVFGCILLVGIVGNISGPARTTSATPAAKPAVAKPPPSRATPAPAPQRTEYPIAIVNKRFTGCFDPQELVRLLQDSQTVKSQNGVAAAASLFTPEALEARECHWLEVGDRVKMIGRSYNAMLGNGKAIEGISVFRCLDDECIKLDTSGAMALGMWFPVDMLAKE